MLSERRRSRRGTSRPGNTVIVKAGRLDEADDKVVAVASAVAF